MLVAKYEFTSTRVKQLIVSYAEFCSEEVTNPAVNRPRSKVERCRVVSGVTQLCSFIQYLESELSCGRTIRSKVLNSKVYAP
jgi:hypothetical protein